MDWAPLVLVVDDDRVVLHTLEEQLALEHYRVRTASQIKSALRHLENEFFTVILADQFMPEMSGLELLRQSRELQPHCSRIIMTGMSQGPGIPQALKDGDVFRFLIKPWSRSELLLALFQGVERHEMMLRLEAARRETDRQRDDLATLAQLLEQTQTELVNLNARFGERNEQLELRARERMEDLAWANLALQSEIAERRRTEQQLRESNECLRETLDELHATQQHVIQQERLQALGKMASGVAHDFNNALVPILGYTELLLERFEALRDSEKAKHYLLLVRRAARDAAQVVGRLKEFHRQREDTDVVEEVDLREAILEAVALTQPKWHDEALASGRHIEVVTDLRSAPFLNCNGTEIREALTNLIFNAVDALPLGGHIVIRTATDEESTLIEVEDNGTGMLEEVRIRCLEPFFTTKGERGTGLGLAMVYGIVERLHGSVEVESEPHRGTLFRIRLPLQQGQPQSDEARTPAVEKVGAPLTVLLVDDDEGVRDVLSEFLRTDGHEVMVAPDGRIALEILQDHPVDLLLTDHAMPELNGKALVEAIRDRGLSMPILMLTGFGKLMHASGDLPKGVHSVLNKPITIDGLRSALAKIFVKEDHPGAC